MIVLIMALAGGGGACSRFIVDGLVRSRLGRNFPWGTIVINFSGSLLLGLITGLVIHQHIPPAIKVVVGTGFCGGYTTFSTASYETVRLIEEKRLAAAALNSVGTLIITLLGAGLGIAITLF